MKTKLMKADTEMPPCMLFPKTLTDIPVSNTAKVIYCLILDALILKGQKDESGILYVSFPITVIAEIISRSPMTVRRSLSELETAGLIKRERQGIGKVNRIYVSIPGKEEM